VVPSGVPVLEDALACGVAELWRIDVCVAVLATGVPAPIEVLTSGVVDARADTRVVALPAPTGAAVTVGALVETLTFVVVPPTDAATEAGEPTPPAETSADEGSDAVAGAEPAPNVAATGVDVTGGVPGILKGNIKGLSYANNGARGSSGQHWRRARGDLSHGPRPEFAQ
jgi:hypothetical protein